MNSQIKNPANRPPGTSALGGSMPEEPVAGSSAGAPALKGNAEVRSRWKEAAKKIKRAIENGTWKKDGPQFESSPNVSIPKQQGIHPNAPKRPPPAAARQASQPPQTDFSILKHIPAHQHLQVLRDVRAKNIPEGTEKFHDAVRGYIAHHLGAVKEITPGHWTTGFDHVREIKSADAVIPNGWGIVADEELIDSILAASIAHLENGGGPHNPPHNAISLQRAGSNLGPTRDPDAVDTFEAPICGKNCFGSQVALPATHPGMYGIVGSFDKTHGAPHKLDSDSSCMQATWLAILAQRSPDEIGTMLKAVFKDPQDQPMIERVQAMATAFRGKDGFDAISESNTANNSFRFKYPGTNGSDDQRNCEEDLNKIFNEISSGATKAWFGNSPNPEGDIGFSASLVLAAFRVDAIILDCTQSNEGAALSIGGGNLEALQDACQAGNRDRDAIAVMEHCSSRPVLVRTGEGFEILMPKREPQQPQAAEAASAHGAGARAPGPAGAPGETAPKESSTQSSPYTSYIDESDSEDELDSDVGPTKNENAAAQRTTLPNVKPDKFWDAASDFGSDAASKSDLADGRAAPTPTAQAGTATASPSGRPTTTENE